MHETSVLVIDDDVWMQRIMSKTLQSFGFNTIYLSSNGFDGISLAVEHIPTVIILDILMPDLTGHLTLKVLKAIKSTREVPVIMVSALSDSENLGIAVKSGIAGFISKPFTRATVYEKMVAIFGKEKMDMIAKGDLNESILEPIQKLDDTIPEKPKSKEIQGFSKELTTPEFNNIVNQNSQKLTDNAMQHYQEDEKKSIESIKKLLLKTKR
jgi:CheY-like chemotaxis protein